MTFKGLLLLFNRLSIYLLVNILILVSKDSYAQSLYADFDVESIVCLDQKLSLKNNSSSDANAFFWDLCLTDIQTTPTLNFLGRASSISNLGAIEVVYENKKWYGFIPGRGDNHLYRLDFGAVLTSGFALVDLGDFGGSLNMPKNLRLIKENGQWNGLLVNVSNSLVRLSFIGGLSQPPIVENLGNLGGMNAPIGLDIVRDGVDYVALISSYGGVLSIINFGPSVLNSPSLPNIYSFGVSPVSGPVGISLVKDSDDVWRGIISSYNDGKIYRVNFDNGLYQPPNFTFLTTVSNPTETRVVFEGGEYYGFVVNQVGNLLRIRLGDSILSGGQIFESLGNFGSLFNLDAFSLVKHNGTWNGFAADRVTGDVFNLSFFSVCDYVNTDQSEEVDPVGVKYSIPGNYHISLMSFDNLGNSVEITKPIEVNGIIAPDFKIAIENACVDKVIGFSTSNNNGYNIVSFDWDFGDNQVSSQESPNHIYNSSGEFKVKFMGAADNGCKNNTSVIHKVYDLPSPGFDLPIGLICTNNLFTFTNNTFDNFDGNLSYQWFVDNNPETTTRDLKYSFLSSGNKDIKLKTSIPGCSSELTQTLLNVQTGPSVGFDFVGKCENEMIRFDNTSIGDISGYLWDFGNGKTSTIVNEMQTYSSNGTYLVSLQTSGTNGCVSSTTKPLTIYTTPQPDFSLELPPFSCSGTPSQFNDLTPSPTDSNLSSWSWSFGDVANGISTTKNPTYAYALGGSYNVSMTATTNFGCSATKLKTIQIAESPKPDFTLGASCLGKPTIFTDASGANNKSWLWKIGGTSYTIQNPTHIFSAPGSYSGELMVTGNNDCVSILSKPIIVYAPPALDFLTENNCSPQTTLFKDLTAPNQDPAISRIWDFAGKGNGTGSSTQFVFPSPGTYNVKLTTSTQSGCSYSLTKSTIIVAAPIADFSTSDDSGPSPLAIQFKNESKNATSYQWRFNDPNNSSSTMESPSFTYTTLGDFMVDLTASNLQGCVDTKSEKIHVIVPSSEVELEQFTLLHDQVTGSVRPVLSIRNNSNYTIKNLEVILDIAGNALVKERINLTVLPNATASQILKYELLPRNTKLDYLCVKLQLSDDRLSDETDLTDNSECISIESNEILFSPYPNPVTDQLNFDWIAEAPGSVKVSVVTQMGQLAYQKDISGVEVGLNQIVLDVSNLNSGFYMLIFESAGSRKTFPFVILN